MKPSTMFTRVNASTLRRSGPPLATARSWFRHAATHLRHSVLPDPATPFVMRQASSAAAPFRLGRQHPVALVSSMFILGFALLLLAAVALLVFRHLYDDRIYPAVVVGDVHVGGLTVSQAEHRLHHREAEIEHGLVVFTLGEQTWTPTLQEIGASVNVTDSLATAGQMGRTGDAGSCVAFTGAMLGADQHAPLQTELNQQQLEVWFDTVDRDIGHRAIDARIVIDGTHVTVSPESSGTLVDRMAAAALIHDALASLRPVATDLPTRSHRPAIVRGDLLAVQAAVEQILDAPVVATFDDQTWPIDTLVMSPYLVVEPVIEDGESRVKIAVATDGLAATLREQYGVHVNRRPVDARIGWEDRAVLLEPARLGAALEATAFADLVAASFLSAHAPVEIPIVELQPAVSGEHLDELGIDSLLGQGDSNFWGGVEGRDANVELAAEFMDGTLVPPGGIFSFNDAIGEITYERGFQEALVVQGEGVGRDVGGGVCQVSTTIFRAALNAGMPITEWYPHTYRFPNYELDDWGPGFDASILQWGPDPAEWPDFEFENYTDSWLLIESYINYPYVHVNIYGSGDGRTVTIDADALGANAFAFTRVLQDAQGDVLAERTFASYYK